MNLMEDDADLVVQDLICSFFMISLNSYRYDSVLRPYPPNYLDRINQVKNISKLRNIASQIPSISHNFQSNLLHTEAHELYKWINSTPFKLIHHNKLKFSYIKNLTKQELSTSVPNHIFEVIQSDESELKFQALKNEHGTFFAYHGSRMDNFHSILHHGLVSHLNKNGLFGYGTYFSSELSVSLHYSASCANWSKSSLGSRISCIAVCEIIDHPSVKNHKNEKNQKTSCDDKLGDVLPQKYYIVANNDLVQIRYLLVYTEVAKPMNGNNRLWQQFKFPLIMLSYVVILLIIGLSNSSTAKRIISQFFT